MKHPFVKNAVRFGSIIAAICCISFSALADEVLNNSSIIDLQKIGLSENTIVQKIKTSKCNFDTSISALKQLKTANVSDNIIQAMMGAGSSATTSTPATSVETKPVAGDINDPATSHDVGVWLFQVQGGKNKMTELEPAVFNQMKTGSGWAMGWGGSAHMRVALNGPKAKNQFTERKPVLYIYFGESTFNGATSPSEFTLVKTEIKKDHDIDTRMIIVGKINGYSGSSMGFDQKSVVGFDYDKIGRGIYKVVPKEDLTDGEYALCQGSFAAGAASKVYDFGISGK